MINFEIKMYFTIISTVILLLPVNALPPPRLGYARPFEGCTYIDTNEELDCICGDPYDDKITVFPNDDFLHGLNLAEYRISSIRFYSCNVINSFLDARRLPNQIKRLRFENINREARFTGIDLRPGQSLEIQFRNIPDVLRLSGEILCPECRRETGVKASLVVQISEAYNATLSSWSVDALDIDFHLKVKQATKFSIWDSYFHKLPPSAIEIFDSQQMEVHHTEFYNVSRSAVIVHPGVKSVLIKDTLLEREILEVLAPTYTYVSYTCTASPVHGDDDVDPACEETLGRNLHTEGNSAGAIIIAIVSAILLISVVGGLFFLHRKGKLEQCL